ncbi:MAG TPA: LLM class flavin-dependent oxidoreductase [Vicinamibacterales bacterium]|nr:LLM class flavin-dependent oxidoreductase [Vicinamibacterales bacterium]
MPVRLSVLDQSPISQGSSGGDALRNSVDLARHAERLGYTRYWVAEHHGTPMLACASPEVLISAIGAATSHIRVGSGGVMLPHYSPLKVAENFSMLTGMYGERVDLALGRAPGSDPITAFALQRDRRVASPDDFPEQLAELLGYINDTLPVTHRFARLARLPGGVQRPDVWLLGSSPQSGVWAAELGLPYAFADFINPVGGVDIVERYRQQYVPSKQHPQPRAIVAIWALCADTDEEANRLAASSRMAFTLFLQGRLIPVPPIETALTFLQEHAEEVDALGRRRRWLVGSPETVKPGIEELAAEYGAEEVMVVTITYDHEARKRSYELLSETFGLNS